MIMPYTEKVLLICAPSSSGKSLLSNIICESDLNFLKLNTKALDEKTRQEISAKYFSEELALASYYLKAPALTVMEIFQAAHNSQNPEWHNLCEKILEREKQFEKGMWFKYLYKNYFLEAQAILEKNKNCIIDHNIFLDPYPDRKNIFLKFFGDFGKNFKILRMFNSIENTLLNAVNRNKRFYDFVLSQPSGQEALRKTGVSNAQKGFSFLTFRQPLRLIENWASMYTLTTQKSLHATVLQELSGREFKSLLRVAHREQEKLLGILCLTGYPLAHVHKNQLICLKKEHAYVTTMDTRDTIYVEEKRFEWDYSATVDNDMTPLTLATKYKPLLDMLRAWPSSKQVLHLNEIRENSSQRRIFHCLEEIGPKNDTSCSRNVTHETRIEDTDTFYGEKKAIFVELERAISSVLVHKHSQKIVYSLSKTHNICATLSLEKGRHLKVTVRLSKNVEKKNETFVFLGKLYAAFKNCEIAHYSAINVLVTSG